MESRRVFIADIDRYYSITAKAAKRSYLLRQLCKTGIGSSYLSILESRMTVTVNNLRLSWGSGNKIGIVDLAWREGKKAASGLAPGNGSAEKP